MELEQLKEDWNILNKKIDQMEILNSRIIEQIMTQKAEVSQERVMSTERRMFVLCFTFAAVYALIYFSAYSEISKYGLSNAFWLFEAVMIAAGAWQGYKMWLLKQMDIENCSPSELVERSIRFKVITKMRFIAGMIILIPVMGLLLYFTRHLLTVELFCIMTASAIIGVVIGLAIELKHFRSINTLIKLLKEVRDASK